MMKYKSLSLLLCLIATGLHAQRVQHYQTTEQKLWQQTSTSLSASPKGDCLLEVALGAQGTPFVAWGTTFNELDLDAYRLLTAEQQQELMQRMFAPDGDLRFTRGRISMNANDYAREWYSCSEVTGDLGLRYFNIEHDKQNIILLAKDAQRQQPDLKLWMSPWSPPAWMKINNDYPVSPRNTNTMDERQGYLLYMDDGKHLDPDEMKFLGERNNVYPRRLALQDFFIQDPRYLQAYADMFCRFIELYREEGLPIFRIMYQNEAYSYTPYPGCAWTAEGTVRFNRDYLAPTLRRRMPEVELYIGTFNTNRQDYVETILDNLHTDLGNATPITGVGIQWECRELLPDLHRRYPDWHLICSESECGNGDMDWKAAEHTFFLLADNLGNGVDEYYNWNFILADNGRSHWDWTQNALVQVDSQTRQPRYTAEYYAYKHFSHFIQPGAQMVGYAGREYADTPVVVYRLTDGRQLVIAGNVTDQAMRRSVKLGRRYLNMALPAHSFHSYLIK